MRYRMSLTIQSFCSSHTGWGIWAESADAFREGSERTPIPDCEGVFPCQNTVFPQNTPSKLVTKSRYLVDIRATVRRLPSRQNANPNSNDKNGKSVKTRQNLPKDRPHRQSIQQRFGRREIE